MIEVINFNGEKNKYWRENKMAVIMRLNTGQMTVMIDKKIIIYFTK